MATTARELLKHKPTRDFVTYFRTGYKAKKDYYCEYLNDTFTYEEIKIAVGYLKVSDPSLYRVLDYSWREGVRITHMAKAAGVCCNESMKRKWCKAAVMVMNIIQHTVRLEEGGALTSPIGSLDLI